MNDLNDLIDINDCLEAPREGEGNSTNICNWKQTARQIESNDESYFPSFVPVCHRFKIDPEWIRRPVRMNIQEDRQVIATAAAA